eukprot:gene5073-5836_t
MLRVALQPAPGAALVAVSVAVPSTITKWGPDLIKLLATSVGLSESSKIAVKIRFGDEEEELKGGGKDWRVIINAEPTDTIIVVPPPPPPPDICFCEHAECAGRRPGFSTIEELEEHHIEEHHIEKHNGNNGSMKEEEVNAMFTFQEDAMTPAWRRRDADSFENGRIRWEQIAHIAKAIVPAMFRELWQMHWRQTYGRDWTLSDGHAFVNGGTIGPYSTELVGFTFIFTPNSDLVKVMKGDPTAVLRKRSGLRVGADNVYFVDHDEPRPPAKHPKDPSKPGRPGMFRLNKKWTGAKGEQPVYITSIEPLKPACMRTGKPIDRHTVKRYEAGDLQDLDAGPLYTMLAGLKESPYQFVGGAIQANEDGMNKLASLYRSGGLTIARMLKHVKDIRNNEAHSGGPVMSIQQYNNVRTAVVLFVEVAFQGRAADGIQATFEREMSRWDVHDLELLPKTEAQRIGKAEKRATELTEKQALAFAEFGEGNEAEARAGRTARWLVEAPSGSGKTVLCIQLAARFVRGRLLLAKSRQRMAAAAGGGGDGSSGGEDGSTKSHAAERMLVLVHSKVLCAEVATKIQEELRIEDGSSGGAFATTLDPKPNIPSHPGIPMMESCIKVAAATGAVLAEVLVMTADAFVDAAHRGTAAFGGTFSAAVVDEGHVCFGYQPNPLIDGQHRCKDPAVSYQRVHGVDPVYPSGCKVKKAPLEIVRIAGHVRDVSVPFSRELAASDRLTAAFGRQSYHPLLNENGSGRAVRLVDVGPALLRGTAQDAYGLAEKLTSDKVSYTGKRDAEAVEQSSKYSEFILAELVRIFNLFGVGSGGAEWARHVAVLVPGSPPQVVAQLLGAVKKAAAAASVDGCAGTGGDCKVACKGIADALPAASSIDGTSEQYGPTGLYFGPVENFAGLERHFVIATGMQHPEYLVYKKEHEGWRQGEMVDPRVYLAVTRWKALYVIQPTHASVEVAGADADGLRFIRVGVAVDLANPPPDKELATAVVLRIPNVDQPLWDSTTFAWEHCKNGCRELDMSESLQFEDDDGEEKVALLKTMLEIEKLSKLSILQLQGNGLTTVPKKLGDLAALTQLTLHNNRLTTVPKELGDLAALTLLRLDNNRLTTVPKELGDLAALTELRLDNNRLTTVPKELGDLAALTRLHLQNNQLTTVPKELGDLAALTRLFLDNNQLTTVPKELGGLAALTVLSLHTNQLTTVPQELGDLAALTLLRLDNNRLTTVPKELGDLAALTELGLQNNRLTTVPKELGDLAALTQLHLNNNRLTTVPKELGDLAALTRLHLQNNQLTTVPKELGDLAALTLLHLHKNQLTTVPKELGGLKNLTVEIALDDHVATDSRAVIDSLKRANPSLAVHSAPSGRTPVQVKLLKKMNARRVVKELKETQQRELSQASAAAAADEPSIEVLLASLGVDENSRAGGAGASGAVRADGGDGGDGGGGGANAGNGKKKKKKKQKKKK